MNSYFSTDRLRAAPYFEWRATRYFEWIVLAVSWAVFFVFSIVYCTFYTSYVEVSEPGIYHSLLWMLQEYGLWLLLSPVLLRLNLQFCLKHDVISLVGASLGFALFALASRVGLDFYLNPNAFWLASIVYFTPTHLTFALVLALFAWGLSRRNQTSVQLPERVDTPASAPADAAPCIVSDERCVEFKQTLEVQKGNIDKTLQVTRIDCICAAGNYMEVVAGDEVYLTRATLNELENQLPPAQFFRTHRSFLVNTQSIVNVVSKAGQYSVVLKNGRALPLAKPRKSSLQALLREQL